MRTIQRGHTYSVAAFDCGQFARLKEGLVPQQMEDKWFIYYEEPHLKWVHFRWACPKFLRQSFHEWAGHSIAHSQWARSYYQQQRERGKGHHAAVRGLAFKWIRIVFRCWKDRVAYDESRYLAALANRNSPLAAAAGTTSL